MNKESLRKTIQTKKKNYTSEQLVCFSQAILERIEHHPKFVNADYVLMYYSLPDEVQTHEFIDKWCSHKHILLPVVLDDYLQLRIYSGKNNLRKGAFNIYEPSNVPFTDYKLIDLAIIPGVSFDIKGNRLGRGKGYYDRLLERLSQYNIFKMGVCFDFQKYPDIPHESYDIVMDTVI
jgi:5-formyltetrahydrofolate cyclo-ligase